MHKEPMMLPYGKQTIDKDDIEAVLEVLQSDWLTTGPKVEEFEAAFAAATGSCLLYTSPSPRDQRGSRMPSSA